MTYEEALQELNYKLWDGGFGVTDDALRRAVNALEKQYRYAWHDLRKNPEDLPEGEVDEVYVCYKEGDIKPTIEYANGVWHPDRKKFTYDDNEDWMFDMDVIAWRYIERFEASE